MGLHREGECLGSSVLPTLCHTWVRAAWEHPSHIVQACRDPAAPQIRLQEAEQQMRLCATGKCQKSLNGVRKAGTVFRQLPSLFSWSKRIPSLLKLAISPGFAVTIYTL